MRTVSPRFNGLTNSCCFVGERYDDCGQLKDEMSADFGRRSRRRGLDRKDQSPGISRKPRLRRSSFLDQSYRREGKTCGLLKTESEVRRRWRAAKANKATTLESKFSSLSVQVRSQKSSRTNRGESNVCGLQSSYLEGQGRKPRRGQENITSL